MIRFLVLLLVFSAGLTGAVLWLGEMHHVRRAAPDQLPGWSAQIAPEARLPRGNADIPLVAPFAPLRLSWSAAAPAGDGLHWDAALTGPGVKIDGDLRLSWWPERAFLDQATGTVDLSALKGVGDLKGLIELQSGSAELTNLMGDAMATARLRGQMSGLELESTDLGSGTFEGELNSDGTWQITFSAEGGITAADGSLSGVLGRPLAELVLHLADPSALPARAVTVLQNFGQAGADGLTLTVPVPLQ